MMLLLAAACSPNVDTDTEVADTDITETDTVDTGPGLAPDYGVEGASRVSVERSSFVTDGCDLTYSAFTPDAEASTTLVVLAHGFSRSMDTMDGHARHLASWGLHVVTPDLCHASFLDTDHAQNGRDLRALADHLGATDVIYAGHSAGGLASWLAAAGDDRARAVIGLDPVDADDLGAGAAVSAPAYGLFGEPSACNAEGNGLAWFGADRRAVRVAESDHCDFESPTDGLCTSFCAGPNPTFSDSALRITVTTMLTAAAVYEAGADPLGLQYWTPGEERYDALADAGKILAP